MSAIKKQSISYAFVSYLGVLIGAVSILFIQPKLFTPDIIGLLGSLSDAAFLFVPFAKFGADLVLIRYYPFFMADNDSFKQFNFFLLKRVLISICITSVLFLLALPFIETLFAEKSPLFANFVYWVVPLGISLVFYSLIEAYTQIMQITTPLVLAREVGLRLVVVFAAIAFFYNWLNVNSLVIFYVVSFIVGLLLLIFYLRYNSYLQLNKNKLRANTQMLRDINNYSLMMMLGGVCGIAVTKIDSLLITKYIGLADNGIYRISFFMSVLIEIPGHALKQLVAPLVATHLKQLNIIELEKIHKRVGNNQLLIGLGLFLGILANIDSLFMLMPNGSIYSAGKYVFLIIGIAKLVDLTTSNNEEIIAYSKYYTWALGVGISLIILTLLTGIYLVPKYGIIGAAWATAASIVCYNAIKFCIVYVKFNIHPFSVNTLKCFAIGIITWAFVCLINTYLPANKIIATIVIRSVVLVTIYVGLAIFWHISDDINKIFAQIVQSLKNKIG